MSGGNDTMTLYSGDYWSRVPEITRRRPGPVASLVEAILSYRPPTRGSPDALPPHLRRDIGLPPIGDAPDTFERFW